MSENIIEAVDVWRRYTSNSRQPYDAVRGISLNVAPGELFGLLGTNGAGKTSFLELLEGLARPSRGSIKVLGHDPHAAASVVRARTGVMLQEAGFPGDLRVREMAQVWAGTLPNSQPVDKVLEDVDLSHRAGVSISSLSGGERRRLDLALALLGNPEVLFLDEPTTGLDPESRRNTWNLIRELQRSGVTMVLTTHYLEEAEELATRLAIMHAGVFVAEGTAAEIARSVPATIRFIVRDSSATLPKLQGKAEVIRDGGAQRVSIATFRLQQDLTHMLNWADHGGYALEELDARSASLEQAFLNYSRVEGAEA